MTTKPIKFPSGPMKQPKTAWKYPHPGWADPVNRNRPHFLLQRGGYPIKAKLRFHHRTQYEPPCVAGWIMFIWFWLEFRFPLPNRQDRAAVKAEWQQRLDEHFGLKAVFYRSGETKDTAPPV